MAAYAPGNADEALEMLHASLDYLARADWAARAARPGAGVAVAGGGTSKWTVAHAGALTAFGRLRRLCGRRTPVAPGPGYGTRRGSPGSPPGTWTCRPAAGRPPVAARGPRQRRGVRLVGLAVRRVERPPPGGPGRRGRRDPAGRDPGRPHLHPDIARLAQAIYEAIRGQRPDVGPDDDGFRDRDVRMGTTLGGAGPPERRPVRPVRGAAGAGASRRSGRTPARMTCATPGSVITTRWRSRSGWPWACRGSRAIGDEDPRPGRDVPGRPAGHGWRVRRCRTPGWPRGQASPAGSSAPAPARPRARPRSPPWWPAPRTGTCSARWPTSSWKRTAPARAPAAAPAAGATARPLAFGTAVPGGPARAGAHTARHVRPGVVRPGGPGRVPARQPARPPVQRRQHGLGRRERRRHPRPHPAGGDPAGPPLPVARRLRPARVPVRAAPPAAPRRRRRDLSAEPAPVLPRAPPSLHPPARLADHPPP